MRRPETDATERAEIAEAAGREVIRLTALVDRLQDLSAGIAPVEPAGPVDAAGLALVVCAAARRRHPAARIEVRHPGRPARTLGTETGLHTVLENLVENALRHGGPEVRVTVTAASDGVRIVVEDNGPGIPDVERTEVVRPFRRGSTAAGAGSGLGLALVREYAASVGGRLSIAGSGLGGARLTVTLPAAMPGPHPG
jgi:signal transduction histidine kinase